MKRNTNDNICYKNQKQPLKATESERNISIGGKEWDGDFFSLLVQPHAYKCSDAGLVFSRKNPIHKQDLKTDDGDWFPERCVPVCTSLSVCVKERDREREDGKGEKTYYIPVRVTQKASEQVLE